MKPIRIVSICIMIAAVLFAASCRSSANGGLFGPPDQTREAAELIVEANKDLTEIKKLYNENEGSLDHPGMRAQLKKALEENNAEQVKKISDDVVDLINAGMDSATSAIDKIQKAQDMNISDDYREYLRLKEMALTKQVEAFEEYRQAARALRDNYDPKNEQLRAKVKIEFDQRSDKYRELTEVARNYSSEAKEKAKLAIRKEAGLE